MQDSTSPAYRLQRGTFDALIAVIVANISLTDFLSLAETQFGGPQGMAIAEHVIEHLAVACGVHIDKMRRDNIYKDGESTHFGMVVGAGGTNGKWNVPKIYDRLYKELDVPKRRAAIDEFNAKNKWLKRGCALLPTKFGIAFTAKYMNQGKSRQFVNLIGFTISTLNLTFPISRWSPCSPIYRRHGPRVAWWYRDGPRFAHKGVPGCRPSIRNPSGRRLCQR